MSQNIEHIDCLIIGSGPAGYTAAIYTSRAFLKTVVYEGDRPGGQLTVTTEIDNFPGYPKGVAGTVMMEDLKTQATRFGTEVRTGSILDVDTQSYPFKVKTEYGDNLLANAIIVATGASAKYLGLESEKRFFGGGVSACAVCDGFFYRGKDVAVVGGGDTAIEQATYLAKICRKVYLLVRRDVFRASKSMQKRVMEIDNIEVLWNTQVKEFFGEENQFCSVLKGVTVKNSATGEETALHIDGFFLAIGHTPNSTIFKGKLDMDEIGYIKTNGFSTKTNVPGIFAAGDVRDNVFQQAIVAAGSGAMAGMEAERFLAKLE